MNIGEHIKQLRKSKGLTQNKLAELLNISTMTVRRWEWGERKPDITVMPKLANTLNTSINELMDLQDSVEKNSTAEGILSLIEKPTNEDTKKITVGRRNDMYIIKDGEREFCIPDNPTGQEIFLKLVCNMFNNMNISETSTTAKLNINNGTNSTYLDSIVNNGSSSTQVEMSETA